MSVTGNWTLRVQEIRTDELWFGGKASVGGDYLSRKVRGIERSVLLGKTPRGDMGYERLRIVS